MHALLSHMGSWLPNHFSTSRTYGRLKLKRGKAPTGQSPFYANFTPSLIVLNFYFVESVSERLPNSDKSESELKSVSLLSMAKKNFDCTNNIKDLFVCFLENNRLYLFLASETLC